MAYIISSGESSEGIIIENDTMAVLDGGITNSTTVNSGGNMTVSSGGQADITTVNRGGIGNDSMYGGGGSDVFTFCGNFGADTVEQPGNGSVLLWFASGSEDNWNAETMTYTDGDDSVKVKGVSAENVQLKFGDDGSDMFRDLVSVGAFLEFTSQKIFGESGAGILAGL